MTRTIRTHADARWEAWEKKLEQEWTLALGSPVTVRINEDLCPVEHLDPSEQQQLQSVDPVRHDSWLRGRHAVKRVLGSLNKSPSTGQLQWPHRDLSLTHSGDLAVAVGCAGPVKGLGIDLELNRPISKKTHKFFLQDRERKGLDNERDALRLWTLKEALFKADPNNAETLLFHYEAEHPEATQGQARSLVGSQDQRWNYSSVDLGIGYITLAFLA